MKVRRHSKLRRLSAKGSTAAWWSAVIHIGEDENGSIGMWEGHPLAETASLDYGANEASLKKKLRVRRWTIRLIELIVRFQYAHHNLLTVLHYNCLHESRMWL